MSDRILHVDGAGPVTVNVEDYDVIVFHSVAAGGINPHPLFPDQLDPRLVRFTTVEVPPVKERSHRRPAWKDPWPGRRR